MPVKVARSVEELVRRERTVALGTSTASTSAIARDLETLSSADADRGHVRSTTEAGDGYAVELLTTLERRLELLAAAGIEETLVVEFSLEFQRIEPERSRGATCGDRGAVGRRRRGLPLRPQTRRRSRFAPSRRLRRARRPAARGRLLDRDPPPAPCGRGRTGGAAARPPAGGRGDRRRRRRAGRHARLPDRESLRRSRAARARVRHLRGRRRRAARRDLDRDESTLRRATSGASRRSCSTSRATSTGAGSSSSSGSGCATSGCSRARRL